jgi:hypothetical protein
MGRVVLCSPVTVSKADAARRLRFLNWKIHAFDFPFGPFYFGPDFDTIPP